MKIKKGDEVLVVYGKDRGKTGKVEKAFPKRRLVVIDGVNLFKKHLKPSRGGKGGIVEVIKPLAVSKVKVICPQCKTAARVGWQFRRGRKRRVCKSCRAPLDKGGAT